jgi:glutamate synthase (NADPH/NADH) large chain
MVTFAPVSAAAAPPDADAPRQRGLSVENAGMGDMLRFDAERLRILIERHHLHTGSARAEYLLDNWDQVVSRFVKVMPVDYARALTEMKHEGATTAQAATA